MDERSAFVASGDARTPGDGRPAELQGGLNSMPNLPFARSVES